VCSLTFACQRQPDFLSIGKLYRNLSVALKVLNLAFFLVLKNKFITSNNGGPFALSLNFNSCASELNKGGDGLSTGDNDGPCCCSSLHSDSRVLVPVSLPPNDDSKRLCGGLSRCNFGLDSLVRVIENVNRKKQT
jgi:hypothetical protein